MMGTRNKFRLSCRRTAPHLANSTRNMLIPNANTSVKFSLTFIAIRQARVDTFQHGPYIAASTTAFGK
jgi:hypothetical protein